MPLWSQLLPRLNFAGPGGCFEPQRSTFHFFDPGTCFEAPISSRHFPRETSFSKARLAESRHLPGINLVRTCSIKSTCAPLVPHWPCLDFCFHDSSFACAVRSPLPSLGNVCLQIYLSWAPLVLTLALCTPLYVPAFASVKIPRKTNK